MLTIREDKWAGYPPQKRKLRASRVDPSPKAADKSMMPAVPASAFDLVWSIHAGRVFGAAAEAANRCRSPNDDVNCDMVNWTLDQPAFFDSRSTIAL
ncbi:hypothetical protein NEUTE1DRAFT_138265 [Neurospora tetrasperma FGSC 2508]|uniref:Uncharacterized protein n=1 Tax=Neurospora tetrasperma (strain FGSC 2508 / ATCC MYA-4615 / P0657) TaxID=510951 RepID=F8MRE8_NEUT8|nr:uncharacterized protein NEUTE1DRAFT_138265 [Neurospora tetrasperma FGSC 2508]EGO56057.1 hypothetical protein NEUTE1DRAFT_138265 [Neurospora tetrasperma FGSC 2508]